MSKFSSGSLPLSSAHLHAIIKAGNWDLELTRMILADTPLFIRMVVMEPVKLLRATQSPLADVKVAVDVSGKRSCRPT